tara:strand:- start:7665 stop:8021 length:357 start_codon:yes stop_codon:yes gene_type:complete
MRKVIYANHEHEILIDSYVNLTKDLISDLSSDTKFSQYEEILEIILEYHNTYGDSVNRQNWYDWIMIIPLNLSIMSNGYLAGLENKKNTKKIYATRAVLTELLEDTVNKIDLMKFKNE